ncbi:MAG: hypothetical protein H7Z43_01495 [Clostridia bacterium]|nr:hypothetical protein [Deltaproteobacteria bacterium]
MSQRRSKIAISIDARLLKRAEHLRARTGETRSALINRALSMLTGNDEHERRLTEYVEAYRRMPETRAELEAVRIAAKRSLARVAWDDE